MGMYRNKVRTFRGVAAAGMCLMTMPLLVQDAAAGSLRVLPVRVEVAPGKQFCSLSVSNDANESATVQIRGYGWSKNAQGEDRLDPETGPSVNPSIVAIPSGGTRLIRCSLASAQIQPVEESYRLIIDELPKTATPGMVQTLLRISVPLFRTPEDAQPALQWAVEGAGSSPTKLVLINSGTAHTRIAAVTLKPRASGGAPIRLEQRQYLLAGGRIEIPVPDAMQAAAKAAGKNGGTVVEVETAEGRLSATPAPVSSQMTGLSPPAAGHSDSD